MPLILPRIPSGAALGLLSMLSLAACANFSPASPPRLDEGGAAVEGLYQVTAENITQIRARALDTLNNTRQDSGLSAVISDPYLEQAANGHSRSMSDQGRAWNFGADGSSPPERARRAGFQGTVLGELVSETYETEVQAIATWMGNDLARKTLLDPAARRIGFGLWQDISGKLWWTLVVAD
ncbi:CAP domain-containing protein [Pseudogemmobacter bohemicus]|uniref:CAP domain-containing protein n=1 Tax=Pseudogemmobacter bohemicus TaxID=2250708 RepID=UPI000DD46EC2|nr:CAP domain-containing protein [Pseudogemmobacter bohemicus]